MSDGHKEVYRGLRNDAERRDYMAQFVIDPQEFRGRCFNRVTTHNSTKDLDTGEWLTEAQLGGPMGLNDAAAAKKLVDSKELRDRPHEFECFKDDPEMKQYYFVKKKHTKETGCTDEATVESETAMSKSEYEEVAAVMRTSMDGPPPRRGSANKKAKAEETPEQKD